MLVVVVVVCFVVDAAVDDDATRSGMKISDQCLDGRTDRVRPFFANFCKRKLKSGPAEIGCFSFVFSSFQRIILHHAFSAFCLQVNLKLT